MNALLGQPLDSFTTEDEVFFAAGVAYRFRNNMFHGNKGVHTSGCGTATSFTPTINRSDAGNQQTPFVDLTEQGAEAVRW